MDRVEYLLSVGNIRRAREAAAELVSQQPDDPYAYLALALVHASAGELERVVEITDAALVLGPDIPELWSLRASAQYDLARFAQAEQSVLHAIELAPAWARPRRLYASLLHACGESARALTVLLSALELDPDDDKAHALLARVYMAVKPAELVGAGETAMRAVELDPRNAVALSVLGLTRLAGRRYDQAEECFRDALAIDPFSRMATEGLAQVLMSRKWYYRPMLQFSLLLSRRGDAMRMGVVFGLWAVFSGVTATLADGWQRDAITAAYMALCVYTWFAQPISRAILRRTYDWM